MSSALAPSDPVSFPLYVDITTPTAGGIFPVILKTEATFAPTANGFNAVIQDINSGYNVFVGDQAVVPSLDVSLQGTLSNFVGTLTATSTATIPPNIVYVWLRKSV